MLVFVAGYTILDAVSAFMGVSKLAVASQSRVRLNVAPQMREENDFSAGLQRVNSDASSSRRAALEHLGTLAIGLGVLSAPPALADTCTRKDCQVCLPVRLSSGKDGPHVCTVRKGSLLNCGSNP